MASHILQKENPSIAKRKRVLAAVAQEIVSSEDDDIVADGMDICNIIENQTDRRMQTATSSALHALGETIKNALLEINEIREQNRERRHRELLQVLKKMVQQENITKSENNISKVTNVTNDNLNHDQGIEISQCVDDQDFLEKINFSKSDDLTNSSSSLTFQNNLDKNHISSATSADSTSSAYIQVLHKPQPNKEKANKLKSSASGKNDNAKKELEKMRAQMYELQRQKMEDRERKKRELIQIKK